MKVTYAIKTSSKLGYQRYRGFLLLFEIGSHYTQADPELLGSSDPLASVSQAVGIIDDYLVKKFLFF
jgi:hypothetical protein